MRRPGGETAGPPLLHGIFPSGGSAVRLARTQQSRENSGGPAVSSAVTE
jgi:hypothetical protein